MALLISLLFILVTSVTGSLTLQRTSTNAQGSTSYMQQIRANQAADGGLALSNLQPNITLQTNDCLTTVQSNATSVNIVANCGNARAIRQATLQPVLDPGGLPTHCTDGHGQDGIHNPHCTGSTGQLYSVVAVRNG